jgi:hypothetical protein
MITITCPVCLSILESKAACVLCGEPTDVDEGELAYHQGCAEDLLRHGQCDAQEVSTP